MSIELTPFAEVSQPDGAVVLAPITAGLPDRSLGHLADVVDWLVSRLDGRQQIARPRLVLIAGDHDEPLNTTDTAGTSDPAETSDPADRADEAITRALAQEGGVGVRDVDVASREVDLESKFAIVRGHPAARTADVLSRAQAIAAIDVGRRIADQEIDAGADLLIPGLVGSGHGVPMGVIISILTGLEPVDALPFADTDVQIWADGVSDLRDTLFRLREGAKDAISLLAAVGGADFAALAGLIAQAATRQTVVVLDGLPAVVAAVLAHRLAPGAESWFIAAGEAPTRRGRRLQELLGLLTVASLATDSPTGAGALLVLPLITAALAARVTPPTGPDSTAQNPATPKPATPNLTAPNSKTVNLTKPTQN